MSNCKICILTYIVWRKTLEKIFFAKKPTRMKGAKCL